MSEQMRGEFEAECKRLTSVAMSRADEGYADWLVQALWIMWQASRAALCVELPEKCEYANPQGEYAKGDRQGRRSIIDAIHAAGVKTR